MKIAVLGWGSLIWDPRNLQIECSWHTDGPLLPLEFARISKGGRLTLVLYPSASNVQTLWTYTPHKNLKQAIEDLRKREETTTNCIGFVSIPDGKSRCTVISDILSPIRRWAKQKGLDAVVWTDLPSNFETEAEMEFNEDNAINYLKRLRGDALHDAETYVRKAPEQIETKIRRRIREEFGWANIPSSDCSKKVSYLSFQTGRMSDGLKRASEDQISEYEQSFQSVSGLYDRFLSDMITQEVDRKKAHRISLDFLGSRKVKFVAVDGTEYSRRVFDLVIFFGGSYASLGEIEFKEGERPVVKYSSKYIEEGRGICSCVPMYINSVPDVDQTFFSEEEPDELSLAIPLRDQEIIDNSEVAERIMHLSEYYLAYKLITDIEKDVKIVLMDRTLAGDQAGLISIVSKRPLWKRRSSLIGMKVDGVEIDENHLDYGRYRILNWKLDILPARADYLKYKLMFLLERDGSLSLEEACRKLGISRNNRKERVGRALGKLAKSGFLEERKGKYHLTEKYVDCWDKIRKLVAHLGDQIFLGGKGEEPISDVLKVEKDGEKFWLTTLDLSFLTLFTFYMLIEECWNRNILLVGLTKDTAARDFKRHVIPLCQNMGIIESRLTPEELAAIPNTDRMFLQSVSLFNYEKIHPPWSLVEYDSSFITIVPDVEHGIQYVRGAIRNKISPERLFLKSYIQMEEANYDAKVRSNVLAIDRLVYPDYDFKEENVLNFTNRYGKTEEPVDVIFYQSNKNLNSIQNLVMTILGSMTSPNIPEAFGHNKPLFIADKVAKWHGGMARDLIRSMEVWIANNPRIRDFVYYMTTFRERRAELEGIRRKTG